MHTFYNQSQEGRGLAAWWGKAGPPGQWRGYGGGGEEVRSARSLTHSARAAECGAVSRPGLAGGRRRACGGRRTRTQDSRVQCVLVRGSSLAELSAGFDVARRWKEETSALDGGGAWRGRSSLIIRYAYV